MGGWLIVVVTFIVGAGLVVAIFAGVSELPAYLMRRRIERRMRDTGFPDAGDAQESSIVKRVHEGAVPSIERLIGRTRHGGLMATFIAQSGARVSASAVVIGSFLLGVLCGLGAWLFVPFVLAPVLAGVLGACLPLAVLYRRRTVRLRNFEEQFPEALDLLSRALRAGHAFTTAMGMVASEGPDPTGPEFKKTFDEQNFGLPLQEALGNLAARVPLLDVRFFVTAVLIQRDTGGNMAEILDNLSHVVRERFKVLRQVRVHTAHGRFTGWVLVSLPAALAIVLGLINPEHMNLLFTERLGHIMLTVAVVLQIIGIVWIKKVIKIEV
jgi:tight adherence protein B